MNYLLILVNIFFLILGQTFWKISVRNVESFNITTIYQTLLSPYFICGGLLYVFATIIWVYLLSKMPLSTLYPMQSLAYVFGLLIGYFVFKEFVSLQKIIGVVIILLGVFIVAK